jgi:serine/threonine protein kinase
MEYCPNGDLANYLQSDRLSGPISKEQRFKWYRQLASGLEYIHGRKIAHRDIKPQNILMTSNLDLKFGDVGIAKTAYDLSQPDSSFEHYYMNQFAGTLPYMAPEVYTLHYTLQSDVFSLGLVFWMIAEKPDPLVPRVTGGYYLGSFLCSNPHDHSTSATGLLGSGNATEFEDRLFDKMLRYDYKLWLTASEVKEQLTTSSSNRRPRQEGSPTAACTCCNWCLCAVVVVVIAIVVWTMLTNRE